MFEPRCIRHALLSGIQKCLAGNRVVDFSLALTVRDVAGDFVGIYPVGEGISVDETSTKGRFAAAVWPGEANTDGPSPAIF
jgi:hypothetical protein